MKSTQALVINLSLGYAILLNVICPCDPHLQCHSWEFLAAIFVALATFAAGNLGWGEDQKIDQAR